MQAKIMETPKFRKYTDIDGEFLRKVYIHGFCTKADNLPEIVHSVQKNSSTKVKIKFIGDVYVVTGIYKTIHDTKEGVKTK